MPRSIPGLVRVAVFDLEGTLIAGAHAALEPVTAGSRTLPLEFDGSLGGHIARNVSPGTYRLTVSADRLESQRREVIVEQKGVEQTVVLGPPGLPFYYRGMVKVPFKPLPLIGVSFARSRDAVELTANEIRTRFKLEAAPIGTSVSAARIGVFKIPETTELQLQNQVVMGIAALDGVRYSGPVVAFGEDSIAFLTDEFVVKFKPDVELEDALAVIAKLDLTVRQPIAYAKNAFLVQARDAQSGLSACNSLVESGSVEYAEPNLVTAAQDDSINPGDFLFPKQWHLPLINVPDAWGVLQGLNALGVAQGAPGDLTFGSERITIAIFDRGIPSQTVGGVVKPLHPDFDGQVTGGASKISAYFDFAAMVPNNDTIVEDHGIKCAGLAAALANNPSSVSPGTSEGIVGVAPNCRVLAISRDDGGTEKHYADAYIWMAGLDPKSTDPAFPAPLPSGIGADVISSSFGMGNTVSPTILPISGIMTDCFDTLTSEGRDGKGVVLCFSVGNNPFHDFRKQRPWAAYDNAIAVAGTTDGDVKASFSPFGPGIDVCAPGKNGKDGLVTCALPGQGELLGSPLGGSDYTASFFGTSASTPLVAGIAALMLSANPDLTSAEVRDILCTTAVKIDSGNTDPVGQWVDTDGDGVADYSRWYGCGRVNAKAAVASAAAAREEEGAPSAPTNLRIVT